MSRVALLLVLSWACSGAERGVRSSGADAVDLQGHRGARGLAPENTLPGFRRALEIGVTTLELDVGMTADGVLVVSHDPELGPELARLDGNYLAEPVAIHSLTLDQVKRFDVGRIAPGTAYAARFPDQLGADLVRIPTLAEVFDFAERRSGGRIRYNIETKLDPTRPGLTASPEDMTSALVALARRRGLQQRVTIQSFDWRSLVVARRRAPEFARACLTTLDPEGDTVQLAEPGASPWLGGLDADDFRDVPAAVRAVGCGIWSPRFEDLDAQRMTRARAAGLRVIPWTVNELKDIKSVLDLGVDGIISDYPDRVRRELARRGDVLPPPVRP